MVSLDDFEVRSIAVILSVPEGVEDLPPSRVTDLAIGSVKETWAASGGDQGTGKLAAQSVSHADVSYTYIKRISCHIKCQMSRGNNVEIIRTSF